MSDIKNKSFANMIPDGEFPFTSNPQVGDKEKNSKLLVKSRYGSLRVSKKRISISLDFDRKCLPPCSVWIEELTKLYSMLNLNMKDI